MTPSPSLNRRKEQNKDAPAFDFYPERWTHGTRHLSKVERCDFLDLLAVQWTEDGIIDDLPRIARMLGYRRAEQIPAAVLEKFPVSADGKRRHPFLEKLRDEQRERIAKAKEKSAKMHQARYQRCMTPAASSAQALLETCPPPTFHHPPQSNILSSSSGSEDAPAREPSGSAALRCRSGTVKAHDPPQAGHPAPSDGTTGNSPPSLRTSDGFPSLCEITNHGPLIGADPACCEAFWQECEAVHWVNKHGVPIADWRPLLARFRTRWNAIEFQNRAAASAIAPPDSARAASHPSSASARNPNRSRHAPAHPSRNPSPITGELNRPGRYASPPAASQAVPPGSGP